MNSPLWIITLLAVAFTLLFSILAYALRIMSRVALEEALERRGRLAALDELLAAREGLMISASILRLLGNSVIISASSYYYILQAHSSPTSQALAFLYAFLITSPLLLIFAVAIPQAWAKYAGEATIAASWPLLKVTYRLLKPLIRLLSFFDELIRRLSGVEQNEQEHSEQVQQEIMAVISEGTAEGTVDEEQRQMIESVISFRDLQVGQIMTPRTEVVGVELSAPLSVLRERILKEGLSRIPVYEGSLDNIVGMLYAKDLLQWLGQTTSSAQDLRKLLRPPLFVPATKPLRDLLREFRIQQVHIAIVLDEYGGTAGLVTSEDIIEEIVGDIADEYEKPEPSEIKRLDDRTLEVDARMNILELNRRLNLQLPEDQDFQTVGGFVISTLGVIPRKGEQLSYQGLEITVLESEPRRVKRLKFIMPEGAGE